MQMENLKAADVFGEKYLGNLTLHGLTKPHERSPKKNPKYRYRRSLLRDLIAFYLSGDTAIQLTGQKGSGKTTLVEQFHAYLGLPLYIFSVSRRSEFNDLLVQTVPTENGWRTIKGPLVRAAEEGASLLLDEYNHFDPAEANGLNQVLQSGQIEVPQLDLCLRPANGFRVYAACNPNGPLYHGRNIQDGANNDRWWFIDVPYATKEEEVPIIVDELLDMGVEATVAQQIADSMVDVANLIRKQSIVQSDAASALEATMSTRVLKRWAKLSVMFKNVEQAENLSPVQYALARAMTNDPSITMETKIAIEKIVEQKMGAPAPTR